jgi:hypothetical protein
MYIQNSSFLSPTYKVIRPYDCSLVAIDGVDTAGKITLQGLEIPYDSFFVSKMTLNSGVTNKPVLYGFLGNDITVLIIKVIYNNGVDPRCCATDDDENYIEYYFADQPSIIRPVSQLMILTGTQSHRIPQVFLNNPHKYNVIVEIMVASIDVMEGVNIDNNITQAVIDGLYYNSIITDVLLSGCTQFEVINENNATVLVLPIELFDTDANIHNIEQTGSVLTITTQNIEKTILKFLSVWDANQAHSRFAWILENPVHRFLTKDSPTPDLLAPVITMNPYVDGIFNITGATSDLLRNYYVESVNDDRDGEIEVNDVGIIIREHNSISTLDNIPYEGRFDILFTIADIAGNASTLMRTVLFDATPPVITMTPAASGSIIPMIISSDSQLVISEGLTEMDVIRKCISTVVDNIDGNIPISAVTLEITGTTFPITVGGLIPITFSAHDFASNVTLITGKTLSVTDDIPPVLTEGLMYSTPTGITGDFENEYIFYVDGGSGTTYNLQFVSGITKDKDLVVGQYYPFTIVSFDLPSGSTYPSLDSYFLMNFETGTTLDYYVNMANGLQPFFNVSGGTVEPMIDGCLDTIDLQMRGDFPTCTLYVSGEVIDQQGNINSIMLTMNVVNPFI